MMNAFELAFSFVRFSEGGWSKDNRDPGGETKYGISQKAYPHLTIKSLTLEEAKAIYKKDYWDSLSLDLIPPDLALCVFDCAVNQGQGAAVGMLQTALGVAIVDGNMGSRTINAAINGASLYVIEKFIALRFDRYVKTENFTIYGKGWSGRLVRLARYATLVRALNNELKI